MNYIDSIVQIAQNNGKLFSPMTDKEEVKELDIPYFQIYKSDGRYKIDYFNYEKHDNAPRMPYYCDYLLRDVFPNVDYKYNLEGYYPIELHDAITYLDNGKDYSNALTFAKTKMDPMPVLIPDPFMIGNYGGRLNVSDPYDWKQKINKVGFFGVTTGNRNPAKNTRLKFCNWASSHHNICDAYITGIAQIEPKEILKVYGDNFRHMYGNYIPQEKQYQYKCLLSVDGNTCSYDRLCWVMNSQSLAFKYPSNEILWYYPLLLEDTHYVEVDEKTLEKKMNYYLNNPKEADFIIKNANQFVRRFCSSISTKLYLTYLMETVAENK
jgi:hypothetical protein